MVKKLDSAKVEKIAEALRQEFLKRMLKIGRIGPKEGDVCIIITKDARANFNSEPRLSGVLTASEATRLCGLAKEKAKLLYDNPRKASALHCNGDGPITERGGAIRASGYLISVAGFVDEMVDDAFAMALAYQLHLANFEKLEEIADLTCDSLLDQMVEIGLIVVS